MIQVFVHGESLKSTLVSIVVPDPETLESWCSSRGVNGNYENLLTNEKVNKLILDDMCTVGKQKGLKAFELVSFLDIFKTKAINGHSYMK